MRVAQASSTGLAGVLFLHFVEAVAEKFIFANCYNPKVAGNILRREGCSTSRVKSAEQLELRAVTGNEKLEPARFREK
ncbi:hypothetical protein [Spirulina sp. 06S082]|uniref:hypothetical protein n=1 Tax=Spirulina sp. 06S082 TaxID=3110248 RepID=UPI002B20430F|nr:hypothetical protein [Spirulina sp. 06S082]MEA5471307.1 hypothetical protein [Spirulina sp. 06S082]